MRNAHYGKVMECESLYALVLGTCMTVFYFATLSKHHNRYRTWPGLCCLMTPGLAEGIRCHV